MMSEHQRETAFLRHLILYDETAAGFNLEVRITQIEGNERCVRGAIWLMALLAALAAAGLCYAAVFLEDFPQNKSQIIIRVLGGVGLGSLICVPTFLGFWMFHRRELDERREECRRLIIKLLESRLGQPGATRWSARIEEPEAGMTVLASKILEMEGEQRSTKEESASPSEFGERTTGSSL